ncbi:glycosyltransferase family 4 protein [Elizabethkingia meningoseptica]|uniref:glycosyltransferase family 4 protein n=1 Tax=Elizabethkingia meningoseptica TaxID=238 RepID=UPI00099AC445|nr:glycosyltransferase family 4 protein [Elizabethkingia meningoseptica]EJK5329542.1 glycosyltransferase family 4 protein [Elizabethkingia meningoseptica]MDE5430512.1 glycosyltransferase family 4 protein [Elizabethkingia meningoseptica]MDE5469382.1 glycosyltransferase family 4 protein [Elizabethkingia meningoseptica]MDE5475296.1 glycosyltransferase family 4 protein [Elizabethkingia meningoseptica]MDE5478729.1 glycosyltransferase family 4 protein [Elizabethkingia meningoseptica]
MKIVYNILGTFNSGGMERVLANKANYLVAQGYDITIITTDQKGRKSYFEMNPQIKNIDLGINYTDNNDKGLFQKLLSYPRKQRIHKQKLQKLLVALEADVVISMFDNDASFMYKIKDGSRKILEIHFSRFKRLQYGKKGLWKIINKLRSNADLKVAKQYDRFVVLTHEDKGYWGQKLPNIAVIPNANSFVASAKAPLEIKRVIAVGRYDYQKGFDELIDVWAKIYTMHPEWSLDIFGHGPLKEELQNQIDRLGLTEVVRLCTPVKNIEHEYLNSSVLAMTSRYEGLPMTLLEAQACGVPLVAYACKCGPRDIIKDGVNGYLIEGEDQKKMAEKLMLLMADTELRKKMGDAAYKFSDNYTEDQIMTQWMELFKQVKKA